MDLAAVVSAARRASAVELRAPFERIAISLRMLATIVESAGATPELARALNSRNPDGAVALIVPASLGRARIDLGQRQIAIPAALRDAILAALRRPATTASSATTPASAAAPVDPMATARLIHASAATAAQAAAVHQVANERVRARPMPSPHATFAAPLLESPVDSASAARRLHGAVQASGLFFEAHLAAQAREERSAPAASLRAEPMAAPPASARTAAQLDVLARDAIVLQGPAWAGQVATIELARDGGIDADAHDGADGGAAVAFNARLALDLPHLGPLEVRLRLVGATIAVTVASTHADALGPELPQLASHLELRGLRPIALRAADRT